MEIKVKIDRHKGCQLINLLKKFGIEFTVEREGSSDFVDLGLPSGLKWATCNVGAKTSTEFGNYFRWGEVVDARKIDRNTNYNYVKPFEDAATYHMGKAWRMPTKEEFRELYDNTTSEWVENYQNSGVNGCLFISKVNGQMLFFPAAGNCYFGSVSLVGSNANVWSSSLYTSNPLYSYCLFVNSSDACPQCSHGRFNGFNVRGVRD